MFLDFPKTQKSKQIEDKKFFFLPTNKLIHYTFIRGYVMEKLVF